MRPAFRIIDELGRQAPGTSYPQFTEEFVKKLYKPMVRLQVMDQVLYEAQRQGRISFYMTTSGEEGRRSHASVLKDLRMIFADICRD